MSAIAAIGTVAPAGQAAPVRPAIVAGPDRAKALDLSGVHGSGFASLIQSSIATMDAKVAQADQLVTRFALDDSVPVHQVTVALEEARLSVELAMQVRARLVEGYRELMNLQL